MRYNANVVKTYRKDVLIKFVRRANMWCKTFWDDNGNILQEWHINKPDTSRPDKKK